MSKEKEIGKDLPDWKPILCLDFDGVLHSYKSGWQGARTISDNPVEGAIEFLVELIRDNTFQIYVYSSRSKFIGGRRAMKSWIKKHFEKLVMAETPDCVSFVCETAFADPWAEEVDFATKRLLNEIKFPLFKPPAFLTIDDRVMLFTGKFPSVVELKNFKPWHKTQQALKGE